MACCRSQSHTQGFEAAAASCLLSRCPPYLELEMLQSLAYNREAQCSHGYKGLRLQLTDVSPRQGALPGWRGGQDCTPDLLSWFPASSASTGGRGTNPSGAQLSQVVAQVRLPQVPRLHGSRLASRL